MKGDCGCVFVIFKLYIMILVRLDERFFIAKLRVLPKLNIILLLLLYTRVGTDYDCNRLHFLCNHNRNRNHTFSKLHIIVIVLSNHL